MTVRPGVNVTSRSAPPPRGASTDTGTWFVVGGAEKGSLTQAKLVRNMTEFERFYGTRQSYSLLWDALETFFREGGTRAYVARVTGTGATTAGRTLNDGAAAASLRVDAKNPGAWGNALSVAVAVTGSQFTLTITHPTYGVVDRSPLLDDQAAAVNWSRNSDWVTVSIPGGAGTNDPAVLTASALSGGADDNGSLNDTIRQAGLDLFARDLGPGQVSMPGNTAAANRSALLAHARANGRTALLDVTDSPSRSALVTEATALQGDEYGALFGPWVIVPGVVPNSLRAVPPSALAAGLMARNDATNSPNVPAAASNGVARFVLDVTQPAFSDADRQLLNEAGVNVIRSTGGQIKLYGYRTLANPNVDVTWLNLANQRYRTKIIAEATAIAESFVESQIDGKGHTIAAFAGALTGFLNGEFAAGSLYGDSSDEAFSVDVGDSVNTPTTIANGELHAVITLRMSPAAEQVDIEIVKVSVAQAI